MLKSCLFIFQLEQEGNLQYYILPLPKSETGKAASLLAQIRNELLRQEQIRH